MRVSICEVFWIFVRRGFLSRRWPRRDERQYELIFIELGHAPTTREANDAGINAHQMCVRVVGNWVDVLASAQRSEQCPERIA